MSGEEASDRLFDRIIGERDEAQAQLTTLRAELDRAKQALGKINAIRNSIIGAQTFNWSEHAYPLVAALNEAGIEGEPYPAAREYVGSLIERANKAEEALDRANELKEEQFNLTLNQMRRAEASEASAVALREVMEKARADLLEYIWNQGARSSSQPLRDIEGKLIAALSQPSPAAEAIRKVLEAAVAWNSASRVHVQLQPDIDLHKAVTAYERRHGNKG